MSQYYTFDAFLSARFEEKTITSLINKGKDLGFMYLDPKILADYMAQISPQEAINIILTTKKGHGDHFFSSESLTVFYQDTVFSLMFYESNFSLNVRVFPTANVWKETYKNEKYVDIGRYTQILIDLCKDFPIMKICTEID